MSNQGFVSRLFTRVALCVALLCGASPAWAAGTTGAVNGTVTDVQHGPLAGVAVDAASPTARGHAVTDASGFYALPNLAPDTYVLSFSKSGYELGQITGVTVLQDQTFRLDQTLVKSDLKTIGRTTARNASNLVQPNQTADVYVVSQKQLNDASGGDNLHKTLYNFMQTVPGVTGSGANAAPRIRGSTAPDLAYELDGIPINDRLTGLFTTNLSNVGIGSIEVFTGGYSARYGEAAQGVINTVVKRGTSPSFGSISVGAQSPLYGHFLQMEYGTATRDRRLSAYVAFDGSSTQNAFNNGAYTFPLIAINGNNGPGPVATRDVIANLHYTPSERDDFQFLVQSGVGRFDFNYLQNFGHPVAVVPCAGAVAPGGVPAVGGTSVSGLPCVDGSGAPTGLQFVAIPPGDANVWYHYSGLGKLQWNHTFNDKLSGYLRLAENANQYIFDQPYDDANFSGAIHSGDVALGFGNDNGADDFYGDRSSRLYQASFELNFVPSAKSSYYVGASYEKDASGMRYSDREGVNSAAPAGGSAFDVNGKFPNTYLSVTYPLYLPSFYFGTVQHFGRLTVEPSLRYEAENYATPAGHYFTASYLPRLSASWAPDATTVFRASYSVTSLSVPASYVYNDSADGFGATGSNRTPFLPGASVQPSREYNTDFSFEKQLRGGASLKITPFYHHSANKLVFFRNYTINPVTGVPKFSGASLPKAGGEIKDTGIEFGLNRTVQGDGLSYYLAATYLNGLSSSQNLGSASNGFTNAGDFIKNHTLYPVSGNPPITLTATGDYSRRGWHLLPFGIYQCCSPYNVLGVNAGPQFYDPSDPASQKKNKHTITDTQVHHAPGYFIANLTLARDLQTSGRTRQTVGILVQNLFNNLKADVVPSTNACYGYTIAKPSSVCNGAAVYDGGYAQFKPGQVPNTQYFYPPISQNVRNIEFFLTTKF